MVIYEIHDEQMTRAIVDAFFDRDLQAYVEHYLDEFQGNLYLYLLIRIRIWSRLKLNGFDGQCSDELQFITWPETDLTQLSLVFKAELARSSDLLNGLKQWNLTIFNNKTGIFSPEVFDQELEKIYKRVLEQYIKLPI